MYEKTTLTTLEQQLDKYIRTQLKQVPIFYRATVEGLIFVRINKDLYSYIVDQIVEYKQLRQRVKRDYNELNNVSIINNLEQWRLQKQKEKEKRLNKQEKKRLKALLKYKK